MANIKQVKIGSNTYDVRDKGALRAKMANDYYGITHVDDGDTDWLRTTRNGLIPYQEGGPTAGHSGLGTSSWYFGSAYVQKVYNTENHIGDCTMVYDSVNKCLNFNFS